jgi:hypothetical protein
VERSWPRETTYGPFLGAAASRHADRISRCEATLRADDDNSDDDVFFGVDVSGTSVVSQAGHTIAIGDGDAISTSLAQGRSASYARRGHGSSGSLQRSVVTAMASNAEYPRLRPVPRASDALSLFTSYIQATLNIHVFASPVVARTVVNHLADLVALSLGATNASKARGVKAARLQTIKADTEAIPSVGPLAVADVAVRHGVTPRQVHKLFETDDSPIPHTHFRDGPL